MNISRRKFLGYMLRAGVLGAVTYPVFIERYIVLTKTYHIQLPNLPSAFSGFRIVQLTDFHYGFLMPLWLIRRIVRTVNALKKDIVVCTGDYVHQKNSTTKIDQVWPVLARLQAPEGVYAVLGNHDHWADTERSLYWMERSGQSVRAMVKPIERNGHRIWIAGGGDCWEDHINFDRMLNKIPADDCRIMLAHNPDSADKPFKGRMDLMLSGHTHGGQVKIPFWGAPILPVQNKNYSYGLARSRKGQRVFISPGLGWSICPVRFNCFPEITIIELSPAVDNRLA